MARAKRIYILIVKVNKLFSFISSRCFLKEIENMFSVFLSSYRNTRESLGELEKAVETLACGSCSHSISRSPKLPLVFLYLDRNTVHVFYFLNIWDFFLRNFRRSPRHFYMRGQSGYLKWGTHGFYCSCVGLFFTYGEWQMDCWHV